MASLGGAIAGSARRALTVDLESSLHGQRRGATLADCRTMCRSCNSRIRH